LAAFLHGRGEQACQSASERWALFRRCAADRWLSRSLSVANRGVALGNAVGSVRRADPAAAALPLARRAHGLLLMRWQAVIHAVRRTGWRHCAHLRQHPSLEQCRTWTDASGDTRTWERGGSRWREHPSNRRAASLLWRTNRAHKTGGVRAGSPRRVLLTLRGVVGGAGRR
jgi:hypothetical protein